MKIMNKMTKKTKSDIRSAQKKKTFWNLRNITTPKMIICYMINRFSFHKQHILQHFAQKPEARQSLRLSKILLSNLAVQANIDTKVVNHLLTANCFTDVHL